jgi:hypothetical protein
VIIDEIAKDLERLKTAPVETFVNAMLISAAHKRASHIRAMADHTAGSVQFFIDGDWEHQVATPQDLHTPIVRRLGVMMGVLPPKKGDPKFGGFVLSHEGIKLYVLVAIDRSDELSALVELVDHETFESGRQPKPPSPHPYRHR